ncbi:MAG: hypothetical protein ACXV2A_05620 [Halobacteriota archaeon]
MVGTGDTTASFTTHAVPLTQLTTVGHALGHETADTTGQAHAVVHADVAQLIACAHVVDGHDVVVVAARCPEAAATGTGPSGVDAIGGRIIGALAGAALSGDGFITGKNAASTLTRTKTAATL